MFFDSLELIYIVARCRHLIIFTTFIIVVFFSRCHEDSNKMINQDGELGSGGRTELRNRLTCSNTEKHECQHKQSSQHTGRGIRTWQKFFPSSDPVSHSLISSYVHTPVSPVFWRNISFFSTSLRESYIRCVRTTNTFLFAPLSTDM